MFWLCARRPDQTTNFFSRRIQKFECFFSPSITFISFLSVAGSLCHAFIRCLLLKKSWIIQIFRWNRYDVAHSLHPFCLLFYWRQFCVFTGKKADNLWPSKFWITSLILFNVAGWIEPFIWIVRNGTGHFLLQHRIILNFFAVFSLWTTWFFCWTFWCLRKKNWFKIPRKKSVNFISTLLIIVQKCSSISAMRNDLMLRAIFDCVINIA